MQADDNRSLGLDLCTLPVALAAKCKLSSRLKVSLGEARPVGERAGESASRRRRRKQIGWVIFLMLASRCSGAAGYKGATGGNLSPSACLLIFTCCPGRLRRRRPRALFGGGDLQVVVVAAVADNKMRRYLHFPAADLKLAGE